MNIKWLLAVGIILHLVSVVLFLNGKSKPALIFLFAGAFALHFWVASLDSFLSNWDERYHALVARNLIQHPLQPTLIDRPVLPIDYKDWAGNHIWLHKQPLFLWQMALSIWLFGANEIAVRLPSVLLSSLLVIIIYRIGKLVFGIREGFVAALLVSSSYIIMKLTSGEMGMDHNDISFIFYVTASVWAWLEYERKQNTNWLLLMGAFAGAAVLCKWLTGMFVFGLFGCSHLFIQRDFFTRRIAGSFIASIVVCALVALPWQLYTMYSYPKEFAYEYAYNALHFSKALENHAEHFWYFIDLLKYQYRLLQVFIFIGMFAALLRMQQLKLVAPLIIGTVAVYAFFTFSATKMAGYVLVVMPIMFLFLASGFVFMMDAIFFIVNMMLPNRLTWLYNFVFFILLALGFYQNFDAKDIIERSGFPSNYYKSICEAKAFNAVAFKATAKTLPRDYIICCSSLYDNIDCMFYTGNTAYGYLNETDIRQLEAKGLKLAAFQSDEMPGYMVNDTNILKLAYRVQVIHY